MYIESYKQLIVWQRAIQLVKAVYRLTDEFPKSEMYGLVSQMRRAAVSIPSNIAEGYKRRGMGEYLNFLGIAEASGAELETQLIISKDLYNKFGYKEAELLLEEVQKMLAVFIKKLNAKRSTLNAANQSGVAVLITVILAGIFLSIVLTLSAIFIPQLKTSGEVKRSSAAAYGAESAVEWCLYVNRLGSTAFPVFNNGVAVVNGYTGNPFVEANCVTPPFKAVGTFQNITRSFEISF